MQMAHTPNIGMQVSDHPSFTNLLDTMLLSSSFDKPGSLETGCRLVAFLVAESN